MTATTRLWPLEISASISGQMTKTQTGLFSSLADSENRVEIMLFPNPIGKTARTSSPLSTLITTVSCSGFKITVFPLEFRKDNPLLIARFKSPMIFCGNISCVVNSDHQLITYCSFDIYSTN